MTFFFPRVSAPPPEIWAVCGSQHVLWREPFSLSVGRKERGLPAGAVEPKSGRRGVIFEDEVLEEGVGLFSLNPSDSLGLP